MHNSGFSLAPSPSECLDQKVPFLLIVWTLPLKISGSAVGESEMHMEQGTGWGPLLCPGISILCLRVLKEAGREGEEGMWS